MALNALTLPSQKLVVSLRDYFLAIANITEFFGDRIYAYRRIDQSTNATPSLSVYSIKESHEKSQLGTLEGTIVLELTLEPNLTRDEIQSSATYLTQVLFLYLNTTDLIEVLEPENPGLFRIGSLVKWDQAKSIGLEDTNKVDTYVIKGTIDYSINLLNYYNALQLVEGVFDEMCVFVETPEEL